MKDIKKEMIEKSAEDFQKLNEDSKMFILGYMVGAYSARTAHPFQRNGAPFRFKLSKAQQVD